MALILENKIDSLEVYCSKIDFNKKLKLTGLGSGFDSFLDFALTRDKIKAAEMLLEHGANPNIEQNGDTLLYREVLLGQVDSIKLLVKYGAVDPKAAELASRSENPEIKDIFTDQKEVTAPLSNLSLHARLAHSESYDKAQEKASMKDSSELAENTSISKPR